MVKIEQNRTPIRKVLFAPETSKPRNSFFYIYCFQIPVMEAQHFTLTFTHERRKFLANCQRIFAFKTPLLRVATGDRKSPKIFIFWEMPDKTIFWHHHAIKKEEMAVSISYALLEMINPAFKKQKKRTAVKKIEYVQFHGL